MQPLVRFGDFIHEHTACHHRTALAKAAVAERKRQQCRSGYGQKFELGHPHLWIKVTTDYFGTLLDLDIARHGQRKMSRGRIRQLKLERLAIHIRSQWQHHLQDQPAPPAPLYNQYRSPGFVLRQGGRLPVQNCTQHADSREIERNSLDTIRQHLQLQLTHDSGPPQLNHRPVVCRQDRRSNGSSLFRRHRCLPHELLVLFTCHEHMPRRALQQHVEILKRHVDFSDRFVELERGLLGR